MKTFGSFHPSVLMVYFLSVLVVAMFVSNPVVSIGALVGGMVFCASMSRKKSVVSDILFYIPLFILIALTNPLFSHNGVTPLFFLNGNPVTLEAFVYGGAIAVMVIGVMMWCKCYSAIMTSDKFLYLFGKAIPKLSLVLSMALRFIPMFKRQFKTVKKVQKAMGLYTSHSYVDKLCGTLRVFSVMISWSLENSIETSISMKARGYGMKGRTSYSLFRFTARDALMLSASIMLIGITVVGCALKSTQFYYYPEITRVKTDAVAWLTYIAYTVLVMLPFIIETKENLRWKYLISKI